MAVAVVTKPRHRRKIPPIGICVVIVLIAGVLIFGFQNCAVDLSRSTPGASTSGACSGTSAELVAVQAAATYLKTNCATCHAVSKGGSGGFFVPEASADVTQSAIQAFTYTNLCAHGGKEVGLKIDGTKTHSGPSAESRTTGDAVSLFTYLNEHF